MKETEGFKKKKKKKKKIYIYIYIYIYIERERELRYRPMKIEICASIQKGLILSSSVDFLTFFSFKFFLFFSPP